jgi:hypothetical protein
VIAATHVVRDVSVNAENDPILVIHPERVVAARVAHECVQSLAARDF